jgi:hypothetical protein
MDPYDRLDSDLALTVCHITDCLREGVVDRDEWGGCARCRRHLRAWLRAFVAGRKATTGYAHRLGYSLTFSHG